MHSFLKESLRLKRDASALLKNSKLLTLLKPCGQAEFTGSYRLGLMMHGDIDIHVVNPAITKSKTISFLNTVIRQGFFRGNMFYDFVKFRRRGFPRGYIRGI